MKVQLGFGLNIKWLSAAEYNEIVPGINLDGLLGSTFSPEDGSCSPLQTGSAYYFHAKAKGVDFRFGENTIGFEMNGDGIEAVITDKGRYSAGTVINAAGNQAREIGAIAVPGLRALAEDPIRAVAASPHLLRVAQLLPGATDAITASLTELDARGLSYYRDTVHGWRRTTPGDLAALTIPLNDAATAARAAPAPIRDTITRSIPAGHLAASGAHVDLQAVLRRRQESLRPSRPSQPIEHAGSVPVPERYS